MSGEGEALAAHLGAGPMDQLVINMISALSKVSDGLARLEQKVDEVIRRLDAMEHRADLADVHREQIDARVREVESEIAHPDGEQLFRLVEIERVRMEQQNAQTLALHRQEQEPAVSLQHRALYVAAGLGTLTFLWSVIQYALAHHP